MLARATLGASGLEVTRVGFGAWAIGGHHYGHVEAEQALASLETYVALGGTLIDTAITYGQSEEIIGRFLRQTKARDNVLLATKIAYHSEKEIRDALTTSLQRLGCDYVDLYYLHAPPSDPGEMGRVLDIYEALRDEGKIRAIGASIRGPDVTDETVALCRQYIRSGRVDVLQVIYSIFRQKNRAMMDEARERGVGIVARTALESGFLTGKYLPGHRFVAPDHRARGNRERLDMILAHGQLLRERFVRPPFASLAQVAARFALDQPGIDAIIMGARSAEQARANVAVDALPPLGTEFRAKLGRLYAPLTEAFNTGG